MTDKYILVGKKAVPFEGADADSPEGIKKLIEWGRSFEISNRRVAQEQVGKYWISTVFLGLDHGWGDGPPMLFETMAFKGKSGRARKSVYQDRCSTWEEAEEMHKKAVALARDGTIEDAEV